MPSFVMRAACLAAKRMAQERLIANRLVRCVALVSLSRFQLQRELSNHPARRVGGPNVLWGRLQMLAAFSHPRTLRPEAVWAFHLPLRLVINSRRQQVEPQLFTSVIAAVVLAAG